MQIEKLKIHELETREMFLWSIFYFMINKEYILRITEQDFIENTSSSWNSHSTAFSQCCLSSNTRVRASRTWLSLFKLFFWQEFVQSVSFFKDFDAVLFKGFALVQNIIAQKDARDLSCLFWSRSPITGSFLKILIFSWQSPAIKKTAPGSAIIWIKLWIHAAPGFSFIQTAIWGVSVFPYSFIAFVKNWMRTICITKNPWIAEVYVTKIRIIFRNRWIKARSEASCKTISSLYFGSFALVTRHFYTRLF